MMEESFVGAMPVLQFLRRFLGYRVTMDDLPQSYDFSGVNGTGGELGTYETIVSLPGFYVNLYDQLLHLFQARCSKQL